MSKPRQYNGTYILLAILIALIAGIILTPSGDSEFNRAYTIKKAMTKLRSLCGEDTYCLGRVSENNSACLDKILHEFHGGKSYEYSIAEDDFYMCVHNVSRIQYEKALKKLKSEDLPVYIAQRNGCFSCHSVDAENIGPSWAFIANSYENKPLALDKLSKKIIEGSKWDIKKSTGSRPVHSYTASLDEDDVRKLLKHILALVDSDKKIVAK